MDKVSFFHYYLGNPFIATVISISIISIFLHIYSALIDSSRLKYNSFIKTCYYSGDVFLITTYCAAIVIAFLGIVIMGVNYNDKLSPYPDTYLNVSVGIYILIPIVMLFFCLQMHISEKRDVKMVIKFLKTKLVNTINQYIVAIGDYGEVYMGLSRIEISTLVAELSILKDEISYEYLHRFKRVSKRHLHDIENFLESIENKSTDTYERFLKIKSKEAEVNQYINDLEYKVKLKKQSILQEEYNYLNSFYTIDFIKAYNFIQEQKKTNINIDTIA